MNAINTSAPMIVTVPRRISDRLEPMAWRMVATSPLRREVSSPTRWVSKKVASSAIRWSKTARRKSVSTRSPMIETK
ncbi:hypothetical protein D3C87_2154360 [compost metagenome]